MSFVNWFNKRIIARIRRAAKPVLIGDEIVVQNAYFALKDASDIIAYEADVYAGGMICLLLSFPGGKLVNVNQEDACWHEMITTLDRLALTQKQSPEWISKLLSDPHKTPISLKSP